MNSNLWVIIPCYNEQEVIDITAKKIQEKMIEMIEKQKISSCSKIVFIDDGSTDNTWGKIKEKNQLNSMFCGIRLSRNFGQQKALWAGMMQACNRCDCIISLDADLQDDVNILDEFINKFQEGYHIVYGVRKDRKNDSWLKRNTAKLFYFLMHCINKQTIKNHSECRLLSKEVLLALSEYKESEFFLRNLISNLGFKSTSVFYVRKKRVAGTTKYSPIKLIQLAIEGLMFSNKKTFNFIFLLSFFCLLLGIINVPYNAWLSNSLNLLCLGVIGEYINKTWIEIKCRPKYHIMETIGDIF